jgi:hypothetical protein
MRRVSQYDLPHHLRWYIQAWEFYYYLDWVYFLGDFYVIWGQKLIYQDFYGVSKYFE